MSELIKKIEHALNASESNLMTDVLNDCLETLSDEWISIDDRLPEKEMCNVLTHCEGGNIAISYFIKDREQARSFHSNRGKYKGYTRKHAGKNSCHFDIAHKYSYKITHWKPLPEPPK
tara:strand:- start:3386 stop:3739 length:354 start_codon:yes stop_codon:yes gene_type:complete